MNFWVFILIFYLLVSLSLYHLFGKAGVEKWKALVPGLNFIEWCKLIGRPSWWAALLLIPIVNIFIFTGMAVDLVRSFGKYSLKDSALAVLLPFVSFFLIGNKQEDKYLGPTIQLEKEYAQKMQLAKDNNNTREFKKLVANNPYKKSGGREWIEAVVFAVFAAAFIRMFLIEAYMIPTSSMEGSLLVGDYLFVSKAHYGIRTPQTIAMIPLLHNRLPFVNGESYLEKPSLKMRRLPAVETIDRNDPVVFNFPDGDSVYIFPVRTWSQNDYRYGAVPQPYSNYIKNGKTPLVTRPVDKRDHYIKRCIGAPGDSLEIRNREVFINGSPGERPTNVQYIYNVTFPPNLQINTKNFSDWGISEEDQLQSGNGFMILILNDAQKEKVQAMDKDMVITPIDMGKLDNNPYKLFPHDPRNFPRWTVDNFGPIYIPKKGATVKISPKNIALYRRIIENYEENKLEIKADKIYINGQQTDSYTFKMNYYWMMGDNRHNSEDSRVWGYVPENHVVGKPLFIWFSTREGNIGKGINWDRIFTSADKK